MGLSNVEKKINYLEAIEFNLMEQPAVQAWQKTRPEYGAPSRVELIRDMSSSAFVCRLVGAGKGGTAVIAKRCTLGASLVEKMFYEDVLPQINIPKLHYYGSCKDGETHEWLFIEDAAGQKFKYRNTEHHPDLIKWLALFHTSSALIARPANIVERNPAYYSERLMAARNKIIDHSGDSVFSSTERAKLAEIMEPLDYAASQWDRITAIYENLPHCVIHGDFKESNIHLRTDHGEISVLVFDWEQGGWGLPGIDMWKLDAEEYGRAVSKHWPHISNQSFVEMKHLGALFRAIDAFYWEVESLKHAEILLFKVKTFDRLFLYRTHLVDAMRSINLSV